MKILLVDNYDSFTHNLAHGLAGQGTSVDVRRNDAITMADVEDMDPDAVVLSPGPGHPGNDRDFGVCRPIVQDLTDRPVLGICLGMQGMAHHTGGTVAAAPEIVHGESMAFTRGDHAVFRDLPEDLEVGRYHSLAVDTDSLPDAWEPLGSTDDGTLMAMAHRDHPHVGLQFHPESILTPDGECILQNFIQYARGDA